MSEEQQPMKEPLSTGVKITAFLGLILFLVVFRFAWIRGEAQRDLMTRAYRMQNVALSCLRDADTREDEFPPITSNPNHVPFTPDFKGGFYRIDGLGNNQEERYQKHMLYGALNNQRFYNLKPLQKETDYFYLGYACAAEAEGLALIKAYQNGLAKGEDFMAHLPVNDGEGSYGTAILLKLRRGLARPMAELGIEKEVRIASREFTPMIIEDPVEDGDNPGGWVVYLNYKMEYLPYPGPFPMTEAFITALREAREKLNTPSE